jgi:8-oxo-dGTP pyrophosphatase MutT (NUDIX family)
MNIQDVYNRYLCKFTEERGNFSILKNQIDNKEDITSRKNFNGHVTASGLVICQKSKTGLMIFHKGLQIYIQPVGHIENVDNSLPEAAFREVSEETGLVSIDIHPWCLENNLPLLIDTHEIPANMKKGEDEHYHHDFMYLFEANDKRVEIQLEEVSDFKWIKLEELALLEDAVGKATRKYLVF